MLVVFIVGETMMKEDQSTVNDPKGLVLTLNFDVTMSSIEPTNSEDIVLYAVAV